MIRQDNDAPPFPRPALLMALFLLLATMPAPAQPAGWAFEQVTTSPPGWLTQTTNVQPTIRADGLRIAFASLNDYVGQNLAGYNQIFVADRTSGGWTFIQLPPLPPLPVPPEYRAWPKLSQDGQAMVFTQGVPHFGTEGAGTWAMSMMPVCCGEGAGNAAATRAVLADVGVWVGTLTQNGVVMSTVHSPTNSGMARPGASMSGDGSRIAFRARFPIFGMNADGSDEIYVADEVSGSWIPTQVTLSTYPALLPQLTGSYATNAHPRLDGSGKRLTFVSDRNLTGQNADENAEIFVADELAGAWTINQVTQTIGGAEAANRNPEISFDGRRVFFESDRNLTGGNFDLNVEIFLAEFAGNVWSLYQVTSTTGGGPTPNSTPVPDGNGTRIAFRSNRDHTGLNPLASYEIFWAEEHVAANAVAFGNSFGLTLAATASPVLMGPPTILTISPTAAGSTGVLAVSDAPAQVPLAGGCSMLVNAGSPAFALLPLTGMAGATTLDVSTLQAQPQLGLTLYGQAALATVGGPFLGVFALSNGLAITVGY